MQNTLSLLTLIYVGPAQGAGVRLPAGSKSYTVQPFEPFACTNGWLRRMTGRSSRFWAPVEFEDHARRCADGQLKSLCALRQVPTGLPREEMITRLCAGIHGDPVALVVMESDLRIACAQAGLSADGDRAALLARLGIDDELKRIDAIKEEAGGGKSDATPPDDAPVSHDLGAEPTNASAPRPIKLSEQDRAQLAQLKQALAADDYNAVWSLATNLTSTRPDSKAKPVVIAWAQALVSDLEG